MGLPSAPDSLPMNSMAARQRGVVRRLPGFFFGVNPGTSFVRMAFGAFPTASTVRATSSLLWGVGFCLVRGGQTLRSKR